MFSWVCTNITEYVNLIPKFDVDNTIDEISSNLIQNWEPSSDSELARLSFTNNILPILEKMAKHPTLTIEETIKDSIKEDGM